MVMIPPNIPEERHRTPDGIYAAFITTASVGAAFFCCFIALRPGALSGMTRMAIYLTLSLFSIFLLYPISRSRRQSNSIPWYDFLLSALSVFSVVYIVLFREDMPASPIPQTDIAIGLVLMALVLEAARRVSNLALPCMAVLAMIYCLVGPYLPDSLAHRGFSIPRVVLHICYGFEGVFGFPLSVASYYIFILSFFGAVLEAMGLRGFVNDLCFACTGGNPALTATLSSGLTGGVCGFPVDGIEAIGMSVIPSVKNFGYTPRFAAALAATSLAAGQIVPPVMGISAFMMAEMLGTSYAQVLLAALAPALIFYLLLAVQVYLEPKGHGRYSGFLPDISRLLMKKGLLFILPVTVVIVGLVGGYSPARAVSWGSGAALVLSCLSEETRFTAASLLRALETGARRAAGMVCVCAITGIIMGVFALTGLGLRFASVLISVSGGNLFAALFCAMCVSILLGAAGIAAPAGFIVTVMVAARPLMSLEIEPVMAYMSIFYFCTAAELVPPASTLIRISAAAASSSVARTGILALRLAGAAFLIPYIIIYCYGPKG